MLSPLDDERLDVIIPGVRDAYRALRAPDGKGIYTSQGALFNKTVFGRDSAMAAKFMVDFDHQAALEVIVTLISVQGMASNPITQEEPGRIHHEWRDFRTWHGNLLDHIPFWLLRRPWGIHDKRLLTYYSLDATALFIRLVHKYATHIDQSVLTRLVTNKAGQRITVAAAVEAAAEWIVSKLDAYGLMGEQRHNRLSLPFQTFQDSLYAHNDGRMVQVSGRVAYVEVQAFSSDALYDAAHLLSEHRRAHAWRYTASRMFRALLYNYSYEPGLLASAIDRHGLVKVGNVSMGWTLNIYLWSLISEDESEAAVVPIVRRLFSDEFLTTVGIRTRARTQPEPVRGVVDYHGSQTVWPMFTFMVIEGLRRHRLFRLAEQLENRLINAYNALPGFREFYIVDRDGTVVLPKRHARRSVRAHMVPEQQIAFSIVPAMTLAMRQMNPPHQDAPLAWQVALEEELLPKIPLVQRAAPEEALAALGPVETRRVRRLSARVRLLGYLVRQRKAL